MSSLLTVRNLTVAHLELKRVERFASAQPEVQSGFAKNLTTISNTLNGLIGNATTPAHAEIASNAQSSSSQDVSIPISSFGFTRTDVPTSVNEVIRLTFEVEGQQYKVDTPSPSQRSSTLTSLSPDPRYEFTAIYLPSDSHLSIFSSAHLESWMSNLRDETPLSALSIPGTHNSPTCHTALPSVRCQAVGVKEQLENGVRFLDIRVQPEDAEDATKEGLILVHSAFPISLTGNKYFRDLQNTVCTFLDANPSESVMISLKREGVGKASDQHLSKILNNFYTKDTSRWFTENRIPLLGEVRKKIVLVRRFNQDESINGLNKGGGLGIDAASWPDNCADGICSSGEIRVQDFYEVAEAQNIDKKIEFSTNHLGRAAECICPISNDSNETCTAAAKQPFFVNFLSGSNFWSPNCWPDRVAARVNPSIVAHLCKDHNVGVEGRKVGDGGTGIVVCDWVGSNGDWDLVRCIVGMNARLQRK